MNDPGNASALRNLSQEERQLAADRRTAVSEERAADMSLDTSLPAVDLPKVAGATPAEDQATGAAPRGRWVRSPPPLVPGQGQKLGIGILLGLEPLEGIPEDQGGEGEVATNQSNAEAICWSAAALRPPADMVEVSVEVVCSTDRTCRPVSRKPTSRKRPRRPVANTPNAGASGGDSTSSNQSPMPQPAARRGDGSNPPCRADAATAAGVCQATAAARSRR